MDVVVFASGVGATLVGCGGNAVKDPDTTGGTSSVGAAGSSGAGGDAATSTGGNSTSSGGGASGGAVGDADCYSPAKNLAHVFEADATGCACDEGSDRDACIQDVALACVAGAWQMIDDDSCGVRGYDSYSPDSCRAVGGVPVPRTGDASLEACQSGFAIGLIGADTSGWVEGGYCCSVDKGPQLEGCGGFSLHSCSDSEYCAYVEGQACGATDASSYCKPRPTGCPDIEQPVCGCDGKTYDNACFANRAGIGIYTAAACPHPTTP
ncbi:MAG TPA: Kazal-type serine protease inhibitor [Polyangiaceae bacterium]|nr:Kazal-type serine protease inhibitor [Polyangiaceae bacterium]